MKRAYYGGSDFRRAITIEELRRVACRTRSDCCAPRWNAPSRCSAAATSPNWAVT